VEIIPPKGDGSSGKSTPVDGTPKGSHVEQLSSKLKQLKLQKRIDKLKKKRKESKSQELASSSSSNEETNASSEEEDKGRKEDNKSYNTTSFNYDNLPLSRAFTSVPVGKAPVLMGWTIPNRDTR
jgi:hypothetical protein